MGERRNKINSKQLMTFIISAQVGMGVFPMINLLVKQVGHDGWITILLLCITSIVIVILMVKLLARYKNKSLYEINKILYGKFIGSVFNFYITLYLFLKATQSVRYFTDMLQITILRVTPPVVTAFLIIIPTVYLIWYGLKSLCRFSNVIYVCMFAILILLSVNLKYVNLAFLMPVGVSGISKILQSMNVSQFILSPFLCIMILYPMVSDKDKVLTYTIYANIISTFFFVCVIIVVTGFFGENMVKHLLFPLYSLSQSYSAPIFERIDLFFLIIWFPAFGMSLRLYFFTFYHSITEQLNINKKTLSLAVLVLLLITSSRLYKDFNQLSKYAILTEAIGMDSLYALIILNYILSFFIKRGTE